MTYAQLEALINKWSLELEDQERHFLQQATQVNAWDRMLVENGEKITSLHKEMEKVKLDQRRLNQELDFILSQQKELEDLLCPLEESVKEQSGTIYMQNADEERERTYKLAENVDAQLKRMSQDLKEIIEHLNTSSGPADSSDPVRPDPIQPLLLCVASLLHGKMSVFSHSFSRSVKSLTPTWIPFSGSTRTRSFCSGEWRKFPNCVTTSAKSRRKPIV